MKTKFPNLHSFSLLIGFFSLITITAIFFGCGKFKEDFQRGVEEGKRSAGKAEPTPVPTPITLSADNLNNNQTVALDDLAWKYQPGDDSNWAKPDADDSGWEVLTPKYVVNFKLPKSGWSGIGWFRLPLKVDESLVGQPLSLAFKHLGASEIYVDGKLVQSFGKVAAAAAEEETYDPDSVPVGITFAQAGEHLIAIRYSNTEAAKYPIEPLTFELQLSLLNPTISSALNETALMTGVQGGIFGICLALGLLHLLLFTLYPRQPENLFYSLFLLAEAGSDLIELTYLSNMGAGAGYIKIFVGTVAGAFYFVSFTAYLYTVLENRLPRYLRLMFLLWLAVIALLFVSYLGINSILSLVFFVVGLLVFVVLMIWHTVVISIVIVRAVARKVDNSWVLGLVGFSFIASVVSSTVLASLFGEKSSYLSIGQFACLTLLIIANAVFLARQFARTSTDLEHQLVREVEHEKEKARLAVVEAENERRAKELEEARALQVSMLPKKLPVIANLEIAAYMKPTTEVGGDYYDFHTGANGTLTVAVGDATGHGLKAGSVVTATKSLFRAFADEPDITDIFRRSSRALKDMNLRGLFMAMTIIKIKDDKLSISAAGMPAAIVYRAATGRAEEIYIKAMPLGSVSNFVYRQENIVLAANDCVLLMSDGFPEMFNNENETLGFEKAAEILPGIADQSAQEIINHLVRTGETWANGRPADDDVTFVVLKVT